MKKETKDEGGLPQWFRDAIDRKYAKELKNWDKKEKEFYKNPNK